MRFRFCGMADCPDWVLAEMNTLSRLSSIKLKTLCQIVVQGILKPPIDIEKSEKLFADSKLDVEIDLKACTACISFIISSAVRYSCDSSVLHSELQQLGLPREHSTSIKRVVGDQTDELTSLFKKQSLKVNPLEAVYAEIDSSTKCVNLDLTVNGQEKKLSLLPNTVDSLLLELKQVRQKMVQLHDNPNVI